MKKYLFEFILFVVFLFAAIILLTKSLWYDELLTTPLILGYNLKDMIFELSYDAHPPLYFICLKLYTGIFGHSIATMKTFNILIEFLIILVCYVYAKQLGNKKYALLVITIFILFPAIYNEIYQIRMYSFAPLLVLLVGIYANKIYLQDKSKLNYSLFIIFSILAIYTHFYAIVGVTFIHFILYISLLKRSKKSIKQILLFALIPIISFLPWIPIFLQQVAVKNDNIGDTSSPITRIIKNIMYVFYTGNYSDRGIKINYIMTALLMLATATVFILFFLKNRNKLKLSQLYPVAIVAIAMPISIMVIFTIFSILFTPLWYSRYLVIYFPLIAFGFAYFIYNLNIKYQYIYIAILSICFVLKIYSTYSVTSHKGLEKYSDLQYSEIKSNDIILDAELNTATYFKGVKQYNLRSEKAENLVYNHIYNWNVKLVNDYIDLVKDKKSFWSTKLQQDSLYQIGNNIFYLDKSKEFEYKYQSNGVISIFKYNR